MRKLKQKPDQESLRLRVSAREKTFGVRLRCELPRA